MSDFRDAAQRACAEMRSLFAQTPLQHNAHLSAKYEAEIYLKREDLSPVRSYKIRGAFNALNKALVQNPDQKTFVCASAGNHAQGMAFVCNHFNVQGVIFMPVTTPAQKIEKTRIFGGSNVEIILSGDYFDDTLAQAQAYCAEKSARFLSPFDDDDVIEGQASVAVEIEEEMSLRPDLVVLPVGGGGLSAGITRYYSEKTDAPELVFTEPAGGASLKAALQQGAQVTLPKVNNFVDGAAVARIGDRNFEALKHCSPDQVYPVSEDRLCTTMIEMLNIEGIVLEPAGALSIDVLADIADQIKGKTVVCVTSGGNFDFERLPEVKERAQKFLGLKKYFILRLPQRPGALKDFLGLLGPKDDIARFEYLKKSARNFGTVMIGIETDDPENFIALDRRINAEGFDLRDITNDAAIAEFLI